MVVVKEDNFPPVKQKLDHIEAVCPGKGGMVKVASDRTKKGIKNKL